MKKTQLFYFFVLLIATYLAANSSAEFSSLFPKDQKTPITVFIHGTLPQTLIRGLLARWDLGLGFFRASDLGNARWFLGKAAWWMHEGDPQQFPLNSTYLYGWTGTLSFQAREQEAEELYLILRHYHGPITIIGHSHGGNVGLLLAQAAAKHHDTHFRIDRLVLLATPIQAVSIQYLNSPVFKQIYSLYSNADLIQILDPQRLYRFTRSLSSQNKIPFFSERAIDIYYPNLIQARISTNGFMDPGHLSFILPSFLRRLGEVFDVLAHVAEKAHSQNGPYHVVLKIIPDKPVYVERAW